MWMSMWLRPGRARSLVFELDLRQLKDLRKFMGVGLLPFPGSRRWRQWRLSHQNGWPRSTMRREVKCLEHSSEETEDFCTNRVPHGWRGRKNLSKLWHP